MTGCDICKDSEHVYINKFGCTVKEEFDFRVEKHYKVNSCWKPEYVAASYLEKSSKNFMLNIDTDGYFCNTFKAFVNINALYNTRPPPNRKYPCKKKPALNYDQMIRGVTNGSELTVYDDNQDSNEGQSEVTVYLADSSNELS